MFFAVANFAICDVFAILFFGLQVFGALLRGCTQKLAVLNLSRNQFSAKKSKEVNVPPSFKAFFSSTVALKQLNMAGNKLPVEALK